MSILQQHQAALAGGHTVATATFLASSLGVLPPIATVFAIIWYLLEIGESKIVQRHYRLWRSKIRRARRIEHEKRVAPAAVGVAAAAAELKGAQTAAALETSDVTSSSTPARD